MINSTNYVQYAIRTESGVEDGNITPIDRLSNPQNARLLHGAMGLCTEAGEFMDAMKKAVFYGKPIDTVNLKEELGDILWYIAIIIDALGDTTIDEIMAVNIAKLKARYPDKFSKTHAEVRDLDRERSVLEVLECSENDWYTPASKLPELNITVLVATLYGVYLSAWDGTNWYYIIGGVKSNAIIKTVIKWRYQ